MSIAGGLTGHSTAVVAPAVPKNNRGDATGTAGRPWQVAGCWFAPGDSTVFKERQTTVVTVGTLYAPAGCSFPQGATVTVDGHVGVVDGLPKRWHSAGQAVHLVRETG